MIKSKDLLSIGVLMIIVAVVSYFVSGALFGRKDSLVTQVEQADPISSEFNYLDRPYFTKNALNPTRDITITENNNAKPLGE